MKDFKEDCVLDQLKTAKVKGQRYSRGYGQIMAALRERENSANEKAREAMQTLKNMVQRPVIIRWREVDDCEVWNDDDELRLVIVDVESGVEYSPMIGEQTPLRRAVQAHLFIPQCSSTTLSQCEAEFIQIAKIAMRGSMAFPWLEVAPKRLRGHLQVVR